VSSPNMAKPSRRIREAREPQRTFRYVAGDHAAISLRAKRGLRLFIGRAGCAICHNTPLFSDDDFDVIGWHIDTTLSPHPDPTETGRNTGPRGPSRRNGVLRDSCEPSRRCRHLGNSASRRENSPSDYWNRPAICSARPLRWKLFNHTHVHLATMSVRSSACSQGVNCRTSPVTAARRSCEERSRCCFRASSRRSSPNSSPALLELSVAPSV